MRLQSRISRGAALRSAAAACLRSETFRLCHFDFDGKFVGHVTQHLRRPCQVSFHGDYAIVSELQGRVTILDKNNVPVAFIGDNPQQSQWANYQLSPDNISTSVLGAI
jgi:hypothetical protein